MGGWWYCQILVDFGLVQVQWFVEVVDGIQYVDVGVIGNVFVDEEFVQVFGVVVVVFDVVFGWNEG